MPLLLKKLVQVKPSGDPATLAHALSPKSTTQEVSTALTVGVTAKLDALELDKLVQLICTQTGLGKQVVKRRWREIEAAMNVKSSDGQAVLAAKVREAYREDGGDLKFAPDGTFWLFTGTHWTEVPECSISARTQIIYLANAGKFGTGRVAATVSGAVAVLRNLCMAEEDPASITLNPPPVINLSNGELWFNGPAPEFRPHKSESGLITVLPIIYDPKATCPKFDAALKEIFGMATEPAEMVRHVQELIGYVVQPTRPHPQIVVFQGGGANGKTSILRVIQALLGPEQVFANSIGTLSTDKFAKAGLLGRLAWIDDDVKEGTVLDDGMLKTMAESKLITARRAYGRREFTFRSVAVPVLATNNTPKINDASYGFERRVLVIPFVRQFKKHEMDLSLFDEIISDELSGVLNRALEGLARLRERKSFKEPVDAIVAKKELLAASNPLQAFVQETVSDSPGAKVPVRVVYDHFRAWCSQSGHKVPFSRNAMKGRLESMQFKTKKSHPGIVYVLDVTVTEAGGS